eukprot:1338130-Amphidinium_carterae.1
MSSCILWVLERMLAALVLRLAGNLLERSLMKPPLVRETSAWTWQNGFRSWAASLWRSKDSSTVFDKIVLQQELAERCLCPEAGNHTGQLLPNSLPMM